MTSKNRFELEFMGRIIQTFDSCCALLRDFRMIRSEEPLKTIKWLNAPLKTFEKHSLDRLLVYQSMVRITNLLNLPRGLRAFLRCGTGLLKPRTFQANQ